jgi:hypothetical protein
VGREEVIEGALPLFQEWIYPGCRVKARFLRQLGFKVKSEPLRVEVQFKKAESNRMDRMDRIKRESTAASLLFLYPGNPVHPVNFFLTL